MSWLKKMRTYKSLELVLVMTVGLGPLLGCGVKGDPLPPEKPTELGRGRPTYQRATEEIMTDHAKPTSPKFDPEDHDDEDER